MKNIQGNTLSGNLFNYLYLLTFALKGHTFELGLTQVIFMYFRKEQHDPVCTREPCMATKVFQQHKRTESSVNLTV